MTILALDTSNKTLSVAVELTDGTIIEQTIARKSVDGC